MCNACGFFCCSSDQFRGCGCDCTESSDCGPVCADCGSLDVDLSGGYCYARDDDEYDDDRDDQ